VVIVVMGPSGAGKTTVGVLLAERLGASFVDADDVHPEANVRKMAAGQPLDEHDRAGWLAALGARIDGWLEADEDVVLACSALRKAHRKVLRRDPARVRFVYLRVPRDVLEARLRSREGHFAGPELLASQLQTLEEPSGALVVDGTHAPEAIVEEAARALGREALGEGPARGAPQ
jgi:gluconokinase